jgi:carbonic anhydrase
MTRLSRREFAHVALGGGAALYVLAQPRVIRAAGAVDVLLLSCMDYRLVRQTERYMEGRGLADKYDHVILAGASLGAITPKYPSWTQTFWQHLEVAVQLHAVHKVMVIDHRDCGAYKVILGEDLAGNPAKETTVHETQLRELRKQINAKQPKLDVELQIMALDGKTQAVT